jgi:hypothetical protein
MSITTRTFIFSGIFLILLSMNSYASDSACEKHLARGISAIESGSYKEAIGEFSSALKEKPEDRTATLYLGIALSRAGDVSASSALKKALSMDPQDPRTNLELGIYFFNRSMFEEAGDYFDNTVRLAPGSEFAAKASQYLRAIRIEGGSKPWAINVTAGGQYDSNVVLNPSGGPLPEGISGKSDWSAVINLNGRYNFLKKDSAECSIGYGFYQNLHARLSDFNITRHLIDIGAGYMISPVIGLRAAYEFEYVYVGGDGYDSAHTVAPSLVVSEGRDFSTVIEYRYRKNNFIDSDLFSDNSDRTGSNNLIGVVQKIPLGRKILLQAGYWHDEDSTRRAFWDYRGDKLMADLRVGLPGNVLASLTAQYYTRDYKGVGPLSGDKRSDREYTGAVSFTKPISERYSVTIGELYMRNKSNIDVFDYSRSITTVFLNARF